MSELEKLAAETERERKRMIELADKDKAAECVEKFRSLAYFVSTRDIRAELRKTPPVIVPDETWDELAFPETIIHRRIKCEHCGKESDHLIDVTGRSRVRR